LARYRNYEAHAHSILTEIAAIAADARSMKVQAAPFASCAYLVRDAFLYAALQQTKGTLNFSCMLLLIQIKKKILVQAILFLRQMEG
jgi:hypothetical protein